MPNYPVQMSAQLCQAPAPQRRYSERNILNSLALYLADQLMCENYLLYWQERDAMQTVQGWYYHWSVNRDAYLADVSFGTLWATARGVLTIVTGTPAVPRMVQRLIDDASVGPADVGNVPIMSLELVGVLPTENYELGSKRKWRARHFVADAYVRNDDERAVLTDILADVFDAETCIAVLDHDAGDLSEVGPVSVMDPMVVSNTQPLGAEATTYEVLLNARLIYVA